MSITRVTESKKDTIIPGNMTAQTVMTKGVLYNKNTDKRKEAETIANGMVAQVFDKQFMLVVDGGQIIDWTDEPGYYEIVKSSVEKGLFGKLKSGNSRQSVYYINTGEIAGIRFGTQNPLSYYDSFYGAELFVRVHGTYSIRITDPVRFYEEVLPKDKDEVSVEDINLQFMSEFLMALGKVISQMAEKGERISYLSSKAEEISEYMAGILDPDWRTFRGVEIENVAISGISYDDASKKLIEAKNLKNL